MSGEATSLGKKVLQLCDIYQRVARTSETKMRFRLWIGGGAAMKRIWRPVTYFLAVVYFLVDLIFSGVARPISEWVGRHMYRADCEIGSDRCRHILRWPSSRFQ